METCEITSEYTTVNMSESQASLHYLHVTHTYFGVNYDLTPVFFVRSVSICIPAALIAPHLHPETTV